jgi:hypothetical protein
MVTERRREGWGRVEVGELAAPERIDVPRFIPDNFVQPARAPTDNNLEKLSESLGFFNRNLQALGAKLEGDHKKVATEDAMRRYQTWLSSTTNTQQLDDIRNGRVHWTADPYVGAIARAHYGQLTAQKLAADIDSDPAYKQNLGNLSFDVEKYIIERAAPHTRVMAGNSDTAKAFRTGLDAIRGGIVKRHMEVAGQAQTALMENSAMIEMDKVLDTAATQGMNTEAAMGLLRQTYKDFGPRLKGGTLDINYGRLDDILLQSLKRRAEDPRQAAAVIEMMALDRVDTETGARLGSLSAVQRHRDTVMGIQKKATDTLGKVWEEDYRGKVLEFNTGLLKQGHSAFNALRPRDITNPVTGERVTYSVEKQQSDAIEATLRNIRGGRDGPENFPAEYDAFVKSGVKHPEWFSALGGAYSGITGMNLSGGKNAGVAPEQVQAIQDAATRYAELDDGARSYVQANLSSSARKFYDAYIAMVRYENRTPSQAASALAAAYASGIADRNPSVESSNRQELDTAVKSLDFSWLPWPFDTTIIKNESDARHYLKEIADSLVMTSRVTPKAAIDRAKAIVEKNGMVINGRLVFGVPGVTKADEAHFQPIFDNVFEQHQAYYKSIGISSSKDLSILSSGNNRFTIVGPDGIPVTGFTEVNGVPRQVPLFITPDMIKDRREKIEKETRAKTIEAIAKWNNTTGEQADRRRTFDPRTIRKGSETNE